MLKFSVGSYTGVEGILSRILGQKFWVIIDQEYNLPNCSPLAPQSAASPTSKTFVKHLTSILTGKGSLELQWLLWFINVQFEPYPQWRQKK